MLRERVGVYVDQSNINMNGGYRLNYSVLRNFCLRGSSQGVHLNVYGVYDPPKQSKDPSWEGRFMGYQSAIRQLGYHIIMKEPQCSDNALGIRKSNADIDIAVDIMESAARLDRIVLVTGDGDFAPLVLAARRLGARVEIIAVDNCSHLLREAADAVYPAWLVPGLLPLEPIEDDQARLRGVIEEIRVQDSNIGLIRFINSDFSSSNPMTCMDPDHGLVALFHHDSVHADNVSILRGAIVEFTPKEIDEDENDHGDVTALEVIPIKVPTRSGWYQSYQHKAVLGSEGVEAE